MNSTKLQPGLQPHWVVLRKQRVSLVTKNPIIKRNLRVSEDKLKLNKIRGRELENRRLPKGEIVEVHHEHKCICKCNSNKGSSTSVKVTKKVLCYP